MLETLRQQCETKKVLTSAKYHYVTRKDLWPKYYWEMFPTVEDYYHELNPHYLCNLYDHYIWEEFTDVFTVRDGSWTFAHFLVSNLGKLTKSKGKLFLIHPELAPLVPSRLRDKFAIWNLVSTPRVKKTGIKKFIIYAWVSDESLGNLSHLDNLEILKKIPADVPVELLLLQRRNFFESFHKETHIGFKLMAKIKELLPQNNIQFIKIDHFLKSNDLRGCHLIDLACDRFLFSDNYVHHFACERGATIEGMQETPPTNSVFDLALSFNHKLHVSPLPIKTDDSIFQELVFQFKMRKDFFGSKSVQCFLRKALTPPPGD